MRGTLRSKNSKCKKQVCIQNRKMRKSDSAAERKCGKRETGTRAFLYTSCGFVGANFARLRSCNRCRARRFFDCASLLLLSKSNPLRWASIWLDRCSFRPLGLQTPPVLASPKSPCAAPSQAPSVAARRRRYNTLDLAGKIVCQGRPCPLWIPPPRNRPVSLDASPQRKNSMRAVMLILRFLCQRGRPPL